MSKKIIAIGGGENGRFLEDGSQTLYETEPMDEEIIRLTNKTKPNYLFIAHAMCFSNEIQDSYYETMRKIYGDKFGCNCKHLRADDLYNNDLVKELVDWADIIYEGGGDTHEMIELWKKTGFDIILKEAWNKGKVICGISAGAVCWFNFCNSDCEESKFETVKCLNWFNAFLTPHCDEIGRYESTKAQLKENKMLGIMLSNCSAIEIVDDKYKIISSSSNDRNFEKGYVLKSYWKEDKYYEVKLEENNNYKPLKELLSTNVIYLEQISLKHEKEIIRIKKEYDKNNEDYNGASFIKSIDNYAEVINSLDKSANGIVDNPAWVPNTCYVAINSEGKIVGVGALRHYLNDNLMKSGGHIGYSVVPSERKKGYGTKILSLILEKAKDKNIDNVLVTCSENNIGSIRVIENNGGILENKIKNDDKITCRYWIDLRCENDKI